MKLLIAGCGYVGSEFARTLSFHTSTEAVTRPQLFALSRSPARANELNRLDVQPIIGNWLDAQSLPELPEVDGLLVAIPHRPDEQLGSSTHIVGLTNLLQRLPGSKMRVVYLSTTGVYGQDSQQDVDEQTPVSPTRPGPEVAVATERWLLNQAEQGDIRELNILRLAGIYGRGRVPLIQTLLAGEPLAVPREGYLNLIHVVDIARLLCHAFYQGLKQQLYVVSDGVPVRREDFYCELAKLCGIGEPAFVSPDPDQPRARRATDKRIFPQRLFSEWQAPLSFPNYKTGLADAVAAEAPVQSTKH